MPTSTLRPNGDVYNNSMSRSTGAVDNTLVNDSSDATYVFPVHGGAGYGVCAVDFGTVSLPAGVVVKSLTPRYRLALSTALGGNEAAYFDGRMVYSGGAYWGTKQCQSCTKTSFDSSPVSTVITTYTGIASTKAWDLYGGTGINWAQADIDAIQFEFEAIGGASADYRIYELYIDVLYANPPTVGTPTVSGTNTALPTAAWSYTAGTDGDVQSYYQVKIFNATTYGGGSFSPDTSSADSDTGVVTSSATAAVPPTSLVAGTTYKAYVRVGALINGVIQYSTGGVGSGWQASAAFTITLDQPAPPTLTVATDAANFRSSLIVQGHDNLLTEQDADAETTVGNWVAQTNCSVARSTTQAISPGAGSVRLSSTAAGDMEARTTTGVTGYAVVAARTYRLRASFRAGATTRSCKVGVRWYDVGGVIIGAAAYSATVSATNAAFIEASADVVAPAGALWAAVSAYVVGPAAGAELFYVDHIALQENAGNAPAAYYRGGFYAGASATAATAVKYYIIEYSDDAGVTWATVRGASALTDPASANQLCATVYDYEMQPNVVRQYRARAYYTEAGNTVQGANAAGSGTVTIDPTEWWLKDPTNAALNLVIYITDEGPMMRPMPRGVFKPLGSAPPIVTKDSRRNLETTLALESTTNAERTALLALFNSGDTLLLQSPSALGPVNRYIEVGDVTDVRLSQVGTLFWRGWSVPYVEVAAP